MGIDLRYSVEGYVFIAARTIGASDHYAQHHLRQYATVLVLLPDPSWARASSKREEHSKTVLHHRRTCVYICLHQRPVHQHGGRPNRDVTWKRSIVMEEGYLDVLFGCEQLFEAKTQLSPIIGTGGQYLFSNPSACISETTDLTYYWGRIWRAPQWWIQTSISEQ